MIKPTIELSQDAADALFLVLLEDVARSATGDESRHESDRIANQFVLAAVDILGAYVGGSNWKGSGSYPAER